MAFRIATFIAAKSSRNDPRCARRKCVLSQNQHSTRLTERRTDRSADRARTSERSREPQRDRNPERSREPQRSLSKGLIVLCCVIAALAFAAVMIYPAAKEYYISTRQRDQLQAEYDAVAARNNEMQDNVDALNTVQGVEDQARTDLDWTQPGETSVQVEGLEPSTAHGAIPDEVEAGSVEPGESWLTRFLDKLFGLD